MNKFLVVAMMVWAGSAFAAIDPVNGGVDTFDGLGLADGAKLTTEADALQWTMYQGASAPATDGFFMDTAPSQESAAFTNTAILPGPITHALYEVHESGGNHSGYGLMLSRDKQPISDLTVKYHWYVAIDDIPIISPETTLPFHVGVNFGSLGSTDYAQHGIRVLFNNAGAATKDITLQARQQVSETPATILTYEVGTGTTDDNEYTLDQWLKVTLEINMTDPNNGVDPATGTCKLYLDDVEKLTIPIQRAAAAAKTHYPTAWINNSYVSTGKGKLYLGAVELDTMNVPAPEVSVLDGATGVANGGTIDVGAVVVDSPTLEKTITIKNDGSVDLTTSDLAVAGDFALKAGETLEATLAPGASDDVVVEMATTVIGAKTGTLTFTTNDADEGSVTINLAGEVEAATAVREWHQY